MAKYIEVQATVDRLPDSIGDRLITTKEDLLWDLDKRTQDLLASLSTSNRHTARYYSVMEELLKSFRARVRKTILPNRLEDWWFYSYEISYQGIGLFLEHMGSAFINEENGQSSSETIDQIFPLIFIPAKRKSAKGADGKAELSDHYSSVVSLEEYGKIFEYVNKKIKEMAESLMSGKIERRPVKGSEDACKSCDYKTVCGYEKGKNSTVVRKYSPKNALELMGYKADENNAEEEKK